MKLSTRSRYGLRFLVDLASHNSDSPIFLGEIAKNQNISEKYLSKLVIPLKGAGIITSVRGTRGGYMIARNPAEITLREIVEALEGKINTVDCVGNHNICERAAECATRDVWFRLNKQIYDFLEGITLSSIVRNYRDRLSRGEPVSYVI